MAQIDPALEAAMAGLAPDEAIEALAYPGPKGLDALGAHLKDLQARGALQVTLLATAGCAAVRAKKPVLAGLALNPLVSRLTANPRAQAG